MFFTSPEDAGMPIGRRWSSGSRSAEYCGVVRVPRRVFQRLLPERPRPERCVEAYYLQRTRFSIAERKLRWFNAHRRQGLRRHSRLSSFRLSRHHCRTRGCKKWAPRLPQFHSGQ